MLGQVPWPTYSRMGRIGLNYNGLWAALLHACDAGGWCLACSQQAVPLYPDCLAGGRWRCCSCTLCRLGCHCSVASLPALDLLAAERHGAQSSAAPLLETRDWTTVQLDAPPHALGGPTGQQGSGPASDPALSAQHAPIQVCPLASLTGHAHPKPENEPLHCRPQTAAPALPG